MLKFIFSVTLLLMSQALCAELVFNPTDSVEVEIGGRIVLQYEDADIYDDDAFDIPEYNETNTTVRRLRPSVRVKFAEDWEARLSWEFGDGLNNVKNAYLRYRGIDWLDIKVGNETLPFGRERMTSSARQQSPERALTGDNEFGVPSRQPGIHFKTDFDSPFTLHLAYADANVHGDLLTEIQFINPWGASRVDDNLQDEGTMTVARVDYNIFGKTRYREGHLKGKPGLTLSLAVMDWDNKDQVVEIDHVEGSEIALAYRGYGLSVDAQYNDISATTPVTINRRLFKNGRADLQQMSVQAGFMVIDKKLEVFASTQKMKADGWEKDWTVNEVGLNYFLDGHNHKIQLSYRDQQNRKGRDSDRRSLFAQWQYNF